MRILVFDNYKRWPVSLNTMFPPMQEYSPPQNQNDEFLGFLSTVKTVKGRGGGTIPDVERQSALLSDASNETDIF